MLYLYLSQLRGDLFQQWRCPQEKLVTEAPPPQYFKIRQGAFVRFECWGVGDVFKAPLEVKGFSAGEVG